MLKLVAVKALAGFNYVRPDAVMAMAATCILGEPREGPGWDGRMMRQKRYPVARNIGAISQFIDQSCHEPQS